MLKKKIIVVDGSSLIHNRGTSAYVKSLVSGLSKINISSNVSIIVFVPINYKLSFVSNNNIKIIKKLFVNKIIWDQILLPFYCWIAGGSLLHYTENTGGSLLPRLLGIKVVLTIHDVSFLKSFRLVSNPSSLRQWIGLIYRKLCINKISNYSRIIFTVSKFAKKDIKKELSLPNKKIIVTYNSLSKNFFLPRVRNKEKKILFITGASNQKNFNFTLQCLLYNRNILKGWKILVVGLNRKNTKFVHYVGEIDRDKLHKFYDQASIMIMPSLYESFSIPIIEALSRELFIISSNQGAAPEIIKNFGILYNPRSCKELKKILRKVLSNKKILTNLNKNKAKNYALSFTDQKLAKATYDKYLIID